MLVDIGVSSTTGWGRAHRCNTAGRKTSAVIIEQPTPSVRINPSPTRPRSLANHQRAEADHRRQRLDQHAAADGVADGRARGPRRRSR